MVTALLEYFDVDYSDGFCDFEFACMYIPYRRTARMTCYDKKCQIDIKCSTTVTCQTFVRLTFDGYNMGKPQCLSFLLTHLV